MFFKRLILVAYAISAASLAIGLMATYMQSVRQSLEDQYASSVQEPKPAPAPMATVVTAVRPLPYGHKLRREDLKQTSFPLSAVPPNVFKNIDNIFADRSKPVLKFALAEGEMIFPSKINSNHGQSALSLLLPSGMRAVTIKVNEIRGVGGFIQPKDRVDVLLTEKRAKEKGAERFTRVLLQNVLIMAIGQTLASKDDQPKVTNSVTVAVDLRSAQKLALAETVGHLSLALRNPGKQITVNPSSVSLSDLKSQQKAPSTLVRSDIKVVRGVKESTYTIPRSADIEKKL